MSYMIDASWSPVPGHANTTVRYVEIHVHV